MSLRTIVAFIGVAAIFAGCAKDTRHVVLISTADQQMIVLRDNIKITRYPVSTSSSESETRQTATARLSGF